MSFQSLPEVAPSAQHKYIQLVTNPQNFLASISVVSRTTRRLVNHNPQSGAAQTCPFVPAARNDPIEAARPTQIVTTSDLMCCMVHKSPCQTTIPPGELMYR